MEYYILYANISKTFITHILKKIINYSISDVFVFAIFINLFLLEISVKYLFYFFNYSKAFNISMSESFFNSSFARFTSFIISLLLD